MNAKPAVIEKNPVKALISQDVIKKKFEEVLGSKAPQFLASLSTVGLQLKDVEPMSIIAAAFIAASLDLPIDRNLGFAHIVPYSTDDGEGNRKKVAQFQMGYKGFIQLALRTGLYERMNARPINAEAFGGFDEVGEPKILWDKIDPSKDIAGYAFAWRLANGFTKIVYWTKERVSAHAKRYSQAYKRGKKDSPWFTHPDEMGLKTVIKDGLSHWGILSVQLQRAIVHDSGTQQAIEGEVEYIDGALPEPQTDEQPEKKGKLAEFTKQAKSHHQEVDELQATKNEIMECLLATGGDDEFMNGLLKAASMQDHKWIEINNLKDCESVEYLTSILNNLRKE